MRDKAILSVLILLRGSSEFNGLYLRTYRVIQSTNLCSNDCDTGPLEACGL